MQAATLSREQERSHLKRVITPEYRSRFPRRKVRPPAHKRALRVRRFVKQPNEQLDALLKKTHAEFPNARSLYTLGELAITLFESRQFLEAKLLMSPKKVEHLEGRVVERLKEVGGFAITHAQINQEQPLKTYGNEERPRIGLQLIPRQDLIEDARAVNEVVRDELELPLWNPDSFDPHISFLVANSAVEGSEMIQFTQQHIAALPEEIVMNGVEVVNRLREEDA